MATPRELWIEASKKYKLPINKRDYAVIVVSSAVSAGVSFVVSKINWSTVRITGNFLIDFMLGLLGVSLMIFVIILFFFWIIRFLNTFVEFCGLVWKKWCFQENSGGVVIKVK